MKTFNLFLIFLMSFQIANSQDVTNSPYSGNKGKFYLYWGWNRGWYSDSDIHFSGGDYDFTLEKVVAKDRQTSFNAVTYFKVDKMTIPQYNFRIGYYLNDHYNISFGMDHMKYVMQSDQFVTINGSIANSGTEYDGLYTNEQIQLKADFLLFEHTDGLNYENFEIRRTDKLFKFKKVQLNLTEGFGIGFLYPRTNVTLLNNNRHDKFHLAGYGASAVAGLNITFFKMFFVQTELKGGYINMPDIQTTANSSDKASQQFWFMQSNLVFGGTFYISGKHEKKIKEQTH